jgi:hypothetical protein
VGELDVDHRRHPLCLAAVLGGLIPVSMGLAVLGVKTPPGVSYTLMHTVVVGGILPSEWTDVGSAAAWIVMLVPFWMGSVWIEARTIQRRLLECDSTQIRKAVVRGNLASYGIFLILGLGTLATALADLPHRKAEYEARQERRNQLQSERTKASQPPSPPATRE